jgi:hypothetical protein
LETRAVIAVAANKPTISLFRPHIFATGAPEQMQRLKSVFLRVGYWSCGPKAFRS